MNQIQKFMQKHDLFVQHNGIKLVKVSPGLAVAKMKIQKYHFNSVNIVQGGAIFTLADFAFAAASNSHGTIALGIGVNIFYMKAVSKGTLTALAREISRTSKLATYQVTVTDQKKELVALFQGMAYRKEDSFPLKDL